MNTEAEIETSCASSSRRSAEITTAIDVLRPPFGAACADGRRRGRHRERQQADAGGAAEKNPVESGVHVSASRCIGVREAANAYLI